MVLAIRVLPVLQRVRLAHIKGEGRLEMEAKALGERDQDVWLTILQSHGKQNITEAGKT